VRVNCTLNNVAEHRFAVRLAESRHFAWLLTPTLTDSSAVHLLLTSSFTFRALCGLASSAMVRPYGIRTTRPVDFKFQSQFQFCEVSMKNKWMSKILMVACLVLTLGGSALAQSVAGGAEKGGSCSNQTLFGDYGMLVEGTLLAPNWPLRTLVKVHFDGTGNLTALVYKVINGTPTYADWTSEGSGTYAVNPDCTGSAVFSGPIPIHFVVVNHGKEFLGVVDGNAITVMGSKVN
jgi:hypothetical protein